MKNKDKKEKKKKKYILNKWSPYILERAKIDDNKNLEEMENETQDQYVADQPAKKGGKLGKGGGDCLVLGAAGFFQTFNHIRFSCNYSGLSSDAVSSDASVSAAGAAAFAKRFGSYALPLA